MKEGYLSNFVDQMSSTTILSLSLSSVEHLRVTTAFASAKTSSPRVDSDAVPARSPPQALVIRLQEEGEGREDEERTVLKELGLIPGG